MSATEHNSIASDHDVIEYMLDVKVDQVRKCWINDGKFAAKADEQCERVDLITIVQIKTKAMQSNMLRGLTCKDEYTSNFNERRERLKQNTLKLARIFTAVIKNSLASRSASAFLSATLVRADFSS